MARIVLAYSGSLATSVAIPSLADAYGAEIVTVTLDVGQGEWLEAVRDRALAAGAARAHVLDVREEFAREYVLRAFKANAAADEHPPIAVVASLVPAVVAKTLVDIAGVEQAVAVAHGAAGGQAKGALLDRLLRGLNPALPVIAYAPDWGIAPAGQIAYARRLGVMVPAAADSLYRVDATLWGRSFAPRQAHDARSGLKEIYALTHSLSECPDEPAHVDIAFARGVPVSINGVVMPFVELLASLGTIAGAHGVGRLDPPPTQGAAAAVYEGSSAAVLRAAHGALHQLVNDGDTRRLAVRLGLQYADMVLSGLWFTPARAALDAEVERVQERVSGVVRLKLFKGDCQIVDRTSGFALSEDAQATYDAEDTFDRLAAGAVAPLPNPPLAMAQKKA